MNLHIEAISRSFCLVNHPSLWSVLSANAVLSRVAARSLVQPQLLKQSRNCQCLVNPSFASLLGNGWPHCVNNQYESTKILKDGLNTQTKELHSLRTRVATSKFYFIKDSNQRIHPRIFTPDIILCFALPSSYYQSINAIDYSCPFW